MKKVISIIYLIITFFVIYFLQTNFFTWFNIAGIMPNLFVIFIIFIGLFVGKNEGFILGVAFGLCIDFLIGKCVGISAILLGMLGIIGEYLDKNFSKDSRMTLVFIVAAGTAIYEIIYYVFTTIRFGATFEILTFIKILLIEIVFNIFITIIIYPIIQIIGEILEEIFKSKKILTRYF